MKIELGQTTQSDADALVQMRIDAMRDSLERIGRFDPERARERFLNGFEPAHCRFILADGQRAGFVQVQPTDGHMALEHLYIVPGYQGKGIGAAVLESVFADANAQSMPVRVGALRDSDSNRFYQRHGFVKVEETQWDIYYVKAPGAL
ncbi:GNAT family N-acetyltransferase [Trinickia sp. NRRL B-1857]|uniref:GNAT family N-acetyltransferase n=1 Tax=Trinickia sp. NRRL B-1857 TaxID=3162879 RepID=UPI003D2BFA3F